MLLLLTFSYLNIFDVRLEIERNMSHKKLYKIEFPDKKFMCYKFIGITILLLIYHSIQYFDVGGENNYFVEFILRKSIFFY